jgi:hypothetical protein
MRTTKFLIAGSMLLAMIGIANAASVSGTITVVNTKADAITLSDGKVFTLPEGIEAESLKVGQTVEVTYSGTGAKLKASRIRVVK